MPFSVPKKSGSGGLLTWEELDGLSIAEQRDRLINLGKPVDSEVESDDCDEEQ